MTLTKAERGGQPLVEIRDLAVDFPVPGRGSDGRRRALHAVAGVSLDVSVGETFGLVGESGSGKTTLGRAVLRLQKTVAGTVTFDGREISNLSQRDLRPIRREMQMIFQDPYSSLNRRLTVEELIRRPMAIQRTQPRVAQRARVAELLDMVGLPRTMLGRYPVELSGGQRQRVGIARALATRPRFIVCDEPISALDVSVQAQIIDLLRSLQEELGIAYLVIGHDLAAVRDMSDTVGVMYLGSLVEKAPTRDLFESTLHPYTMALISAAPIPDPRVQRTRERIILQGELPSPLDAPRGCAFASRCPVSQQRCWNERPTLVEARPGHLVACHFWNDIQGLAGLRIHPVHEEQ